MKKADIRIKLDSIDHTYHTDAEFCIVLKKDVAPGTSVKIEQFTFPFLNSATTNVTQGVKV